MKKYTIAILTLVILFIISWVGKSYYLNTSDIKKEANNLQKSKSLDSIKPSSQPFEKSGKLSPTVNISVRPIITTSVPKTLQGNLNKLPTTIPSRQQVSIVNSNEIQLILSKTSFHTGETVEVTIVNKGKGILSFYLGPRCGVLFEHKINNDWKSQSISYDSEAPCKTISLNTNESVVAKNVINSTPPTGAYRVHFQYIEGDIYSAEFTIL